MNQYSILSKLFPKIKKGGKFLVEVLLMIVGLILLLKNLRQEWNIAGLMPSIFVLGLGVYLLGKRFMASAKGKQD